MPNPWALLRSWSSWRGLAENLEELGELLRRVGGADPGSAYAADLAEAIGAVLADPAAVKAQMPGDYRVEVFLGKPGPVSDEDGDFDVETELTGWIGELARQVADMPALLEAPGAAHRLGQALTTDLPRMWQARFGALLLKLRLMLRGTGGGKAKTGSLRGSHEPGGEPAAPAPDWPGGECWQPQFAMPGAGGYRVVLPFTVAPAELLAARKELLYFILRDMGPDAARLHLLLTAAGGEELDGPAVVAGLGLGGQKQRSRQVRTDRCRAAIEALQDVRLSVLRWDLADGTFTYEHSEHPLWELRVREYGQACFVEQDGALVTRGEEWSVLPGKESWAPALPDAGLVGHLALFSSIILEELQGRKEPLSLAIAVLLAFGSRLSAGEPLAVPNRHIVRLAGLEGLMAESSGLRDLWQSLRKAARLQRRWGWAADFGEWPREGEEGFLQAATLFHFSPDLAAESMR